MTAYNNLQVFSISPGNLNFDVLSDEFSPYSTIVPNGNTAPFQNTDMGPIFLTFNDIADTVPEPGAVSLLLAGGVLLLFKRRRT